ncbi:MAG: hypothetical protein KDA28_02740, partial [Phycisphaerales bacterium]|nr:hypothetical protein [Phycisphaerales bacterium]
MTTGNVIDRIAFTRDPLSGSATVSIAQVMARLGISMGADPVRVASYDEVRTRLLDALPEHLKNDFKSVIPTIGTPGPALTAGPV